MGARRPRICVVVVALFAGAMFHAVSVAEELDFGLSHGQAVVGATSSERVSHTAREPTIPPLELSYARLVADAEEVSSRPASNDTESSEEEEVDELAELSRKLENPLSDVWAIVLQNNTSLVNGDAISGTEVQYSVIQPDDYGTEWNFRLQIVPVLPNPFK